MAYKDFKAANGIFRVVYTETIDIASNTSIINVTKCQFKSTNWYQTIFYGDGIVQINGNTVVNLTNDSAHSVTVPTVNEFYDIKGSQGIQSVSIVHNSDGFGSMDITLKGRPGVYDYLFMFQGDSGGAGTYYYKGTLYVDLTKIVRSFKLRISTETGVSIVVNRTSSPLGGSIGSISNGATIYYNDVINVTYSVDTGYEVSSHTINENTFNSGSNYTVTTTTSIVATTKVLSFSLSLSVGTNSTITVNRTSSPRQGAAQGYLNNGSTIYYGDMLSIGYGTSDGYNIDTHTLNGTEFTSGVSHNVTSAVSIVTTAKVKSFNIIKTVETGTKLIVRRTASPNGNGNVGILSDNTVYYGDILELTASANAGYGIELMSVNGDVYMDNPHIHTVTSAITIVIESKALGFVYIDSGSSIEKYKIIIDSGSVMEQYRVMIDTGSAIIPY